MACNPTTSVCRTGESPTGFWLEQRAVAGTGAASAASGEARSFDGTGIRIVASRGLFVLVRAIFHGCSSVFLFVRLALSGYISARIAVGLRVACFLVSIEVYLATYAVGRFHLSFAALGPTELRLLLIAGNLALLRTPCATLAGKSYPLFDVGGAIGIAGMGVALVWSIVKHAGQVYCAERVS